MIRRASARCTSSLPARLQPRCPFSWQRSAPFLAVTPRPRFEKDCCTLVCTLSCMCGCCSGSDPATWGARLLEETGSEGDTMLRQRRQFRPVFSEALEDRTVPSPFGIGGFFGGIGGFFGGRVASVPAQDARQVAQAFATFQQTYSQDVRSILLPARTAHPAANRPAFNAAVATALGTLNTSIDARIANLPTASSLDATIQGELLGSGTNTLQTLLGAIPTPRNIGFHGFRAFNRESALFINQVSRNVSSQVKTASAADGEHQPDDDPAGSQPGPDRLPDVQPDLLQRRTDNPASVGDDHPLDQSTRLRHGSRHGAHNPGHEYRLGIEQSPPDAGSVAGHDGPQRPAHGHLDLGQQSPGPPGCAADSGEYAGIRHTYLPVPVLVRPSAALRARSRATSSVP